MLRLEFSKKFHWLKEDYSSKIVWTQKLNSTDSWYLWYKSVQKYQQKIEAIFLSWKFNVLQERFSISYNLKTVNNLKKAFIMFPLIFLKNRVSLFLIWYLFMFAVFSNRKKNYVNVQPFQVCMCLLKILWKVLKTVIFRLSFP